MRVERDHWRAPGAVALLLLAACGGDDPVEPPPPGSFPVATTFELASGGAQQGLPGLALPTPIEVLVRDQDGLRFPAAEVSFRAGSDGSTSPSASPTGFDGIARTSWTLGPGTGPQTLQVRVAGLTDVLTVQAEAVEMDPSDVLVLDRGPAGTVGLLASGLTSYGTFRDYARLTESTETAIGDFRALTGPERSELAVFSPSRPPLLLSDPWTDGDDRIEVTLPETMEVPVTVWVLQGPFENTAERFETDRAYTDEVYSAEGLGIALGDVEIVDATADPDAPALLTFTCGLATTARETIGFEPDRLNLYYVGTVDGGADRGVACGIGDNFVAMARSAFRDLLSHEIGHMFGLRHIDTDDRFGRTNIMHSASVSRQYLTEGQVFRAHWGANTALNATLEFYPPEVQRPCLSQFEDSRCVSVANRLFPDGEIAALVLSHDEQSLLSRCSTEEDHDSGTTSERDLWVRTIVEGPSPALMRRIEREAPQDEHERWRASVRAEALRRLVRRDDPRAADLLLRAESEPAVFGDVVEWARAHRIR